MALSIPALSLQYVQVPTVVFAGGVQIDPTLDTVQLAFTLIGASPTSGDWKTGSWDTAPANGTYLAQCLVGPGGTVTLARGTYSVWVKITDDPEIPVAQVGTLQIF